MKHSILFGGRAGQGANILTYILSQTLAEEGYYVFYYRDYQSLIRGGHSFNVLSFSDEPIHSNESRVDLIVSLDENTTKIHKNKLNKRGIILDGKEKNMYFAGRIYKALDLPLELLIKRLKKLDRYEENLENAKRGYEYQKEKLKIEKIKKTRKNISSGSISISEGAIKSGLDVYFAYPMTPATAVLSELAQKQKESGHLVLELENEIAVANAGAGSAITGAKTLVGTSGGGFCLMSEVLSMCGMAKIPLVFYLAQRPGPATGVATYTAQGDLELAKYSGHGEFPRIVLAPGDPVECEELISQIFHLTQKFSCPGIILSDKHLAESFYTYEKNPKITKSKKLTKFGRYNSYEKDLQTGSATEDAKKIIENVLERRRRQEKLRKECEKFSDYKIYGNKNSKNAIVFWGSTKGAIIDAIKNLDVCAIQILYLEPFPKKIEKILKEKKKIIGIENNSTGQLCSVIRKETGIEIKDKILRYDGRPFLSDELKKELVGKGVRNAK